MPNHPEESTLQHAEGDHIVQAVNSTVAIVTGSKIEEDGDTAIWIGQLLSGGRDYSIRALNDPIPVPTDAGPSALLAAHHELVEFVGRTNERAELASWLAAEDNYAIHLVTGPSGQGKSRLALQTAREAQAAGWLVVTARHLLDGGVVDSDFPKHEEPKQCVGVLVLVDYADRWPTKDLYQLLADHRLHSGNAPVRALLIGRSGDFWASQRDVLAAMARASMSRSTLAALGQSEVEDRKRAFVTAVTAFCLHPLVGAGELDPGMVLEPANLHTVEFSSVLSVHLAALAGVLSARDSNIPSEQPDLTTDPAAASRYLIRRELRSWDRLRAAGVINPLRCSDRAMARTVFVATLVRGLSDGDATKLMTSIEGQIGESARCAIDDHSRCYPSPNPAMRLEPLLPDRLGEDFIAAIVPGDDSVVDLAESLADLADPAVGNIIAHLLRSFGTDEAVEQRVLKPAITTLVETSLRWPHVAAKHLLPAIAERPQLALAGGGSTLARLSMLEGVDQVLSAIDSVLDEATNGSQR
ncbi:MAG: ATP-binding protein [Nocardioides sp.]